MSEYPTPPPSGGDPRQPGPGWQPGQQPPYGAPQYPGSYGPVLPDHPQATTVLILGIVGAAVCGFVAPVAWVMGNRVVKEIDASNGTLGGRSTANVGRILGIVWTVLLVVLVAAGVLGLIVLLLTAA